MKCENTDIFMEVNENVLPVGNLLNLDFDRYHLQRQGLVWVGMLLFYLSRTMNKSDSI